MSTRIEATYDRTAAWYDVVGWLWLTLLARGAVRRFRRLVAAQAAPNGRLLDLGTGTGLSLGVALAAADPALAVGVDRSAGMLARARRRWRADRRVHVVRADATRLPFRTGTFDLMTSVWLLETTPDPQAVVREAVRVATPRGTAVMLFSADPPGRLGAWAARVTEWVGGPFFRARFLAASEQPCDEAGLRVLSRHQDGWAAAVVVQAAPVDRSGSDPGDQAVRGTRA